MVAPANNNFASAETVALVGRTYTSAPLDSSEATTESGEAAAAERSSVRSLWWKFTPSATGVFTIDTTGSFSTVDPSNARADTQLVVYTGPTLNTLAVLTNDDDSGSAHGGKTNSSWLRALLTAGTTYWIQVGTFSVALLTYALRVEDLTPPNDDFASATSVAITTDGGTYTSPLFSNFACTTEPNEPSAVGANVKSCWWEYVPKSSGTATIDTTPSRHPAVDADAADTQLAVYTGTALTNLVTAATDEDSGGGHGGRQYSSWLQMPVTAGTTYRIQVGAYGGAELLYGLQVVGPATETSAPESSLALVASGESDAVAIASVLGFVSTNQSGGRIRLGSGQASWTPPVVPPPVALAPDLAESRVTALAFGPVTMAGPRPTYTVQKATTRALRPRLLVGNVDVTWFRGVPTPIPGYALVEPLLYGAATLAFPQIAPCFEVLGAGDLYWLRKGATVLVQYVDPDTEMVAEGYRGLVIAPNASGASLTVECGGEVSGRAALIDRQVPIFQGRNDIGRYASDAVKDCGARFEPALGPETGIRIDNFGGSSHLDYIHELVAKAWTRAGNQWSIMPGADGAYRMARKDRTTIHATVYLDDARNVPDLRSDAAEEPNRIYATGVAKSGMRVKFGVYPGMVQSRPAPYPMANDSSFGEGTTDAGTDTGDGITIMIWRLQVTGYLDQRDAVGGYDNDVVKAIKALQDDAGRPRTGNMNPKTWAALFNLDVTGYALTWSHIEPAAQLSAVKRWRRNGGGSVIGENPNYDPNRLKVDATVDMGRGFGRDQIREWSKAELEDGSSSNWVGTIALKTGAVLAGEHTPGIPIGPADIMHATALRPGMNIWAPLFDGGTLLHISGVDVSAGEGAPAVTLIVDTRARDTMKVWEVIQRNRESRRNPARTWIREHRASGVSKDAVVEFDEIGGKVEPIDLDQGWTVFPVVAGQEGTIARLRLHLNPAAEFVVAVFGQRIGRGKLASLIGDPLTRPGRKRWENEDVRDELDRDHTLLYVAGDDAEPLGYYPRTKTGTDDDDTAPAPLTGRWEDDAGFAYRCPDQPILWVAVFTDRKSRLPGGRIMWPQLEAGA